MHLNQYKLFKPPQSGFRKGFSANDAVLCFTESISNEVADNKIVHAVLFDLSNAFDSIYHKI